MARTPADDAFLKFRATGRAEALADVFDRTAADLLRVAVHLAPDLHAAEDLVQETFLAAIEHRAAFRPGEDVAAWLLGILRNRARRSWRVQARTRPNHERAGGEPPRDPAEAALASELTAEVDAALQQLPDTYRPVLRLHLRHGLAPAEIALVLERPAGSVRTQLGRGLALLRARLPRGLAVGIAALALASPGLAAVRATVLHAASFVPAPAAALVGLGASGFGIAMKKIVLGAAAAAIVLLACTWQLGAFASGMPTSAPAATASLRVHAELPQPPVASAAPAVDAAGRLERELVPAPEPTGDRHGTLLVHVRWKDDGTPAAHVTVVLLDETRANPLLTSRAGVTGSDGTVRIERVPAGEICVVTNDEVRPRVLVPAGGEARVDVAEPRWGQVRGIVIDEAGAPVAGATVIRSDRLHYTRAHEVATTGTDGRFELPLWWNEYVGARKAGSLDSFASVRPTKGETLDVTLRLRGPAGAIAGAVRDARGAPVHGALVTAGTGGGLSMLPDGTPVVSIPPALAVTGLDGSFRLDGLPAGKTTLVARAPGFARARQRLQVATGKTTEVAITLADDAALAGRVVDASGVAVAAATVTVGHQGYYFFESNQAITAADGSFHLDGLPAGAAEIRASKQVIGRASTKLDLAAGETATWEANLVAVPVVRGRVVDEAGMPVASAEVQVASLDLARRRTAKGTTAADGCFAIECEQDEPMSLRVSVQRGTFPSVEVDEVVPDGAPITVTIPAARMPSAHVRGVLVGPDGAPATAASLVLLRGAFDATQGQADPATGAFTMGPFPPGGYQAFVQTREPPHLSLGSLQLEAGATRDLGRIVVGEAGTLQVEVTAPGGEPLHSGWLDVLTRTGWQVAGVPIRGGAATVLRVAPGDYLVRAQGARSQDRALQHAAVGAGQQTELAMVLVVRPTRTVTVREVPRAHHEPIREVEVDVLDASGELIDRAAKSKTGDEWVVEIVAPPEGGGSLVVKGDRVERTRLPLPAEGVIEVTLR